MSNIAGSYMGGPGSYHGDHNFSAAWRGGGKIWDIPGLKKYHGQKINLTEAITREVISEVEKTVEAKKPFYLYIVTLRGACPLRTGPSLPAELLGYEMECPQEKVCLHAGEHGQITGRPDGNR